MPRRRWNADGASTTTARRRCDVAMTEISAERRSLASPLPEWISLARARFSVASDPVGTTAQWLDFWEGKSREIISQVAAADQQIRLRRPTDDLRLSFQHDNAKLILDGRFGRVLLCPRDATHGLQLHSSEACRAWRHETSSPRSMALLSQIAEVLLGKAEADLQGAVEDGRCSIWARPRADADFEIVPADRWRLYNLRPIIVRSEEKRLDDGRRRVRSWSDPVDADGPTGGALYSIHVSLDRVASASPLPVAKERTTTVPGSPSKRRGAPLLYEWPKIKAQGWALLLAKGLPHRSKPTWTKEKFRTALLEWCEQNKLGSPANSQIDAHLNPVIAEFEKHRPAKKLR